MTRTLPVHGVQDAHACRVPLRGATPLLRPPRSAGRPGRRVLTAVEFDVLWEWLGLGTAPAVLRISAPGRTRGERRRVVEGGWSGLRATGLADLSGPEPELVRLLHLLVAPAEQLELRMRLDRELRVLAAGRPGAGALAVAQDETVTLSGTTDLAAAVLDPLPALPAGPGPGPGDGDDLDHVTGRGRLSAVALDRCGVPRRHRRVLGLLDTARGRYLTHRSPGGHGDGSRTVLTPVDPHGLEHRARRLLAAARAQAARE